MATADGNFWLGAPDTSQRSSASLTRREDVRNIKDHDFGFETTNRHSSYTVSFRSGGGATTRKSGAGRIVDEEMVSFGINRPWARKDDKIKTAGQADQFVKRQMSDARRASFHLVYEVEGHSTIGPSGEDVIWGPETTVDVADDELNIHRQMYVEGVRMVSAPTLTYLTLCRLPDILNATPEDGFVGE
jgi:prophage tail gpP-like protein